MKTIRMADDLRKSASLFRKKIVFLLQRLIRLLHERDRTVRIRSSCANFSLVAPALLPLPTPLLLRPTTRLPRRLCPCHPRPLLRHCWQAWCSSSQLEQSSSRAPFSPVPSSVHPWPAAGSSARISTTARAHRTSGTPSVPSRTVPSRARAPSRTSPRTSRR